MIWVPGEPVAKGRPRLGRNGHVFTPEKTRTAEHAIARLWWEPMIPIDIPVEVRVTAYMSRPQSHFLKSGALSKAGRSYPFPMKRPDLDNVLKLVLDALNGVAYRDDSQVQRFAADRFWADAYHPEDQWNWKPGDQLNWKQSTPGLLIKVRPAPLPGLAVQ